MVGDAAVSTASAIFKGRCPRCGQGKLFKSFLGFSESCSACSLPIAIHDQGDGPAFFAILFVGMLTGIFAAVLEIKYSPAFWVHGVIWVPFIIITSLVSLRVLKAALFVAQYQLRRDDFLS